MRCAAAPAGSRRRNGQARWPAPRRRIRPPPSAGSSASASRPCARNSPPSAPRRQAHLSRSRRGGDGHPSIPVSRLMSGTTRSSGRCFRVVISARIERSAGETNGRPLPDRPAIAAGGAGVLFEADRRCIGRARHGRSGVTRLSLCSTAAMPCGVIGKSETVTTVPIMVPNSSRFTGAGLDADFHSRLDVLAAVRPGYRRAPRACAFAFDDDDRRTDGKHRACRNLDFKHTPLDRADHLGVLAQHLGRAVHLPARFVERNCDCWMSRSRCVSRSIFCDRSFSISFWVSSLRCCASASS